MVFIYMVYHVLLFSCFEGTFIWFGKGLLYIQFFRDTFLGGSTIKPLKIDL